MRLPMLLAIGLSLALLSAPETHGQITSNPIPEPIEKRGLSVEIREVARLPDTRGLRPPEQDVSPAGRARINYLRELPDGRRFVNDSRGFIYQLDANGQPSVYLDFGAIFPFAIYSRLSSGLIAFTFHPEFAQNGLFYTVHGERAAGNPKGADFIPPGYTPDDVTYHNVITEWRATDPTASTFDGARREVLRIAHIVANLGHAISSVEFDPTLGPGDPDYGLLYISGSDLGFSNGGGPHANNPGQTQRLDSMVGAILRIDPRSPSVTGGTKGFGDYTITPANRFAADGDPSTLGEIYAYGLRNAHRLSWDLTDGTMFASDIGMNHVEEINIVHNGGNYGWMAREGIWENGRGGRPDGTLNQLYPLAPEILDGRMKDGFTYPVAMYDHDEGFAVSGGFAYYGRIPQLRGKFVFGDLRGGRVFAADVAELKKADDGVPVNVAPIEEIQLYVRDAHGTRVDVSFQELVDEALGNPVNRADLHFSRGRDGELYLTSRQDGVIRMLVPDSGDSRAR